MAAPPLAEPVPGRALKVDIGCGTLKRPGFVGLDLADVTDHRCDISTEALPFDDGSVVHLFSSHCLEHIQPPLLAHVFQEFTRVAEDGALIELWHPYALHRDAHIFDHKTFLTEENYYHMCYLFPEHWRSILGGRWVLEEVRYNVEPDVIHDLAGHRVELDFAIQHMNNVVKELGVFIRVEKGAPGRDAGAFVRSVAAGPRQTRYRELGVGPYRPGGTLPLGLGRRFSRRLRRALANA